MNDMPLFKAMHSQRAIRLFTSDPVSEEDVNTILEAAVRAPSPGNRQTWRFIVVRDEEKKRRLGEWYLQAWRATVGSDNPDPATLTQPYRLGYELGARMGDIPVVIVACVQHAEGWDGGSGIVDGASIYPAAQNLMLAARALGLGTVLTTMHRRYEQQIKEFLGIPAHVETAALIPLGYPGEGQRFGGSIRKPVADVTFYDSWGR